MRRHGFMTDEVVDLADNMHVVPREIADIAVLTEPLTIAEKALIELDSVLVRMPWVNPAKEEKRGLNAVVLGAGPVGLLGALALLVRGFDTWIYSRESASSPRAAWVERSGPATSSREASRRRSRQAGRERRSHLRGDRLGRAGLRCPAGHRQERCLHLHGRSGPQDSHHARCRANHARLWCWKISSSTGRSTPDRPRSRRRSAIWGNSTQRWPGPVRELITGHFAPEQITDILSPGHGGIKNVIRFGTPLGVAAGAKAAAASAKGGARG